MFHSLQVLEAPGLSTPSISPGPPRPRACSLEALLPGFLLQTDRHTSTFSASFSYPSATLVAAACLIKNSHWVGRLRERDKAEIQGEKDESLQNSVFWAGRAVPGAVPLRQGSAIPDKNWCPWTLQPKTAFWRGYLTEGLLLDCPFLMDFSCRKL